MRWAKETTMRTIGKRKEHPITFSGSGTLLAEAARFNDEIHHLPTGNTSHIPKGLYRFKTLEDANRHHQYCLVDDMARIALGRSSKGNFSSPASL
jgi:hypothetical protein